MAALATAGYDYVNHAPVMAEGGDGAAAAVAALESCGGGVAERLLAMLGASYR